MRVPSLPVIVVAAHVAIGAGLAFAGQPPAELLDKRLRKLFPAASTFSGKGGSPPHYKAFAPASGGAAPAVVGYAFWTTDLEPLESGYDGPIQMLVGITPRGVLAGVVVAAHREPYGYFSVDPPEFAAQFDGKDVRDPFKVGTDVEAISRATITIASATRAIRNSSRRFARQMLTPPGTPPATSPAPAR